MSNDTIAQAGVDDVEYREPTRHIPVWRLGWRVSQHAPRVFWVAAAFFTMFFVTPIVSGWLLSRAFSALQDGETSRVLQIAGWIAVAEIARMGFLHVGILLWTRVWTHMQTFLRGNLLHAQMASGGDDAGRPVASAGEAITHFRDDIDDIAHFVDHAFDSSAGIIFAVIAGFILGAADVRGVLVIIVPLVSVVVVTRVLDHKVKQYRAADRRATAAVTGLVGDVMAAATTIKVNGAADHALDRLDTLTEKRRQTAVRDRVLDEGIFAFSEVAADFGLGLVILVSAASIVDGSFTVATLALFVAYLGWLTFIPRVIGRLLARRKQATVAFDRMRLLVADDEVRNTVKRRSLPIEPWQHPRRPDVQRPPRVALEKFEVRGLTVAYDDNEPVAPPLSFTAERGTLTVITGPVGSGKSSVLRAMLGLAGRATVHGELRWNGELLDDPAAFLVPPNAAYLPQVPRLISDSVHDNVSLGPLALAQIEQALEIAAIAGDVAAMPDGGETLIGPRGLRLSGGQRQRLATARAIVHRPELLVLDDLSSAVDVETEVSLWENLASAGLTVIAVSHRAVAFERAAQVITLGR